MSDQLKKALIGAVVALALAFAVSYGLITQQTADQIQTKANETLSDDKAASPPASPSPAPPQAAPQSGAPPAPAPTEPAPQNPAQAPRQ